MRAITIYQPWASLIAVGAKKYETRSWATRYRGPITIHAGIKYLCLEEIDSANKGFKDAVVKILGKGYAAPAHQPRGAVIATAELVGCYQISEERNHVHIYVGGKEPLGSLAPDFYHPTEQEILFGDWTPGRYAWELANVQMLPEPIPCRGKQGLWDWRTQNDQKEYEE